MLTTVHTYIKIFLDVTKVASLIQSVLENIRPGSVLGLVQRFVKIYKAHGIERTQLPRLLGKESGFTLDNVSTDEKLIEALDESTISKTCESFWVQREWLDGKDVPIYPPLGFYKDPKSFIDFLADLKKKSSTVQGFVIKCSKDKLRKGGVNWPLAVVFRAQIDHWDHFSEEPIWHYYPLDEPYYWGYAPARLNLKAMILIAWQFDIIMKGCQLAKKEDIESIITGSAFPGPLLEPLSHATTWHSDDYIFAQGESCQVADHDEALRARKFLEDKGCMEKLVSLTGPLKTPTRN